MHHQLNLLVLRQCNVLPSAQKLVKSISQINLVLGKEGRMRQGFGQKLKNIYNRKYSKFNLKGMPPTKKIDEKMGELLTSFFKT